MSARGGAKNVKRFERSDGLDTALHKNYFFLQDVLFDIQKTTT